MYVMQAAAQTGVAQEAIPGASAKLSLLSLFMSADLVVQAVMVGLLLASIWVWAIVVDKFFLYRRTKRAMDQFEQTFWSGHSLEELYRTQSARPAHSMAALKRTRRVPHSVTSVNHPRDRATVHNAETQRALNPIFLELQRNPFPRDAQRLFMDGF